MTRFALSVECNGFPGALAELAVRCKEPVLVDVADREALAQLARSVLTSRTWQQGGKVYCVHWTPVVD